jgi:hypothetical protein
MKSAQKASPQWHEPWDGRRWHFARRLSLLSPCRSRMAGSSLVTLCRPPRMRGIRGRTLTVALLMTELICRRLGREQVDRRSLAFSD